MKVLHLSSERSWRGGEQQIAYLITELENKGIKNFVACKKGSAFENYCVKGNVNFFNLPFKNEFDLYTAYKIKKICEEYLIDIIHIHSSHSHGIAIWSSILGNRTILILSRKVDFPIKRNFLSYIKYNNNHIKNIICVSNKVKEVISKGLKDPSICEVIHDGIDLTKFNDRTRSYKLRNLFSIPDNAILVGNISAIAPHKDYFTFVETAIKSLNRLPNLYFVAIGSGPLYNDIKTLIKKHNLENRIFMTGFRNDVVEIMADLDIFLMTSKTEGLGSTILDALSCGIPVIATAAGGIPEVITDKKNGLLADVEDSDALAEKIELMVSDDELRKDLIREGLERVKDFSKENMANRTLEVYKKAIKSQ